MPTVDTKSVRIVEVIAKPKMYCSVGKLKDKISFIETTFKQSC